jgi:hypothetical protein
VQQDQASSVCAGEGGVSKITNSARMEDCTIRLPGVCNFNTETTVFMHIDKIRFGKGVAIKASEGGIDLGAYGCSGCHSAIHGTPCGLTPEYIYTAFLEGVVETWTKLIRKGLVKI